MSCPDRITSRCTLATGFWVTSSSGSVLILRRYLIYADDRCIMQSVYTVHKLETPISPPQLGLLSTVNIDKALAEFWEERGYDNTPIGVALARRVEIKPNSNEGVVYGISVVIGFVAGFVGTVVTLWWRSRRRQKANSARSRVSSRRY